MFSISYVFHNEGNNNLKGRIEVRLEEKWVTDLSDHSTCSIMHSEISDHFVGLLQYCNVRERSVVRLEKV